MITLNVDGERVSLVPNRMINAGYSGRDKEAVQEHIEELEEDGVAPPDSVSMFYAVALYTLLVDPDSVPVVREETSGEAEVGFFISGRETYIFVASDHSDRELETVSVPKAK